MDLDLVGVHSRHRDSGHRQGDLFALQFVVSGSEERMRSSKQQLLIRQRLRRPRYHFSTSKGDEFVNQNHGSGPTEVLHGNGNNFTIDNT